MNLKWATRISNSWIETARQDDFERGTFVLQWSMFLFKTSTVALPNFSQKLS